LAEKVMALRESARHLVEDKKILPAQLLYDASNKLAHDMLEAFPSGGLLVAATLESYKAQVPGFQQRADGINGQFRATTGVDVYSLAWTPLFDPWQDKMLSGDYAGARDAVETQAGDATKSAYEAFKNQVKKAAATAAWYTKATYWIIAGAAVLFVGLAGWGVATGVRHRIARK
jgi:hypothetical protein